MREMDPAETLKWLLNGLMNLLWIFYSCSAACFIYRIEPFNKSTVHTTS